jgi:hypothetical protein
MHLSFVELGRMAMEEKVEDDSHRMPASTMGHSWAKFEEILFRSPEMRGLVEWLKW